MLRVPDRSPTHSRLKGRISKDLGICRIETREGAGLCRDGPDRLPVNVFVDDLCDIGLPAPGNRLLCHTGDLISGTTPGVRVDHIRNDCIEIGDTPDRGGKLPNRRLGIRLENEISHDYPPLPLHEG